MRWDVFFSGWDWAFAELAKPGVLKSLAVLTVGTVVTLFLLSRIVRWLMNHQFREARDYLLERYEVRCKFLGIKRDALILIADCMALAFALKMLAELGEPFVITFFSAEMSERVFGVARYDWFVLSALTLLLVIWWGRFCWRVKMHDATITDSKIDRTWRRTILVFARPATGLLLLMFLPDLCRFGATIGANWTKASLPDFASAQAAATSPMLERNYASGLRVTVTLGPKERIAAEVGR